LIILDLAEGVRNRRKRRLQLRSETLHHGDDGDRDAGGDETILDGRRARLILHKTRNKGFHRLLLKGSTWLSELVVTVICGRSDRGRT
jgi:hypothetical protein